MNAISSSNYNQSYSNYKKGPSKKSQPEFESSSDEEDTKKKKKKKEPEEEEFDEVKEGNENPFDFQPKENPIKKNPPQISIKKPQSKQVQKSHHDEEFEEVQEENNDIFALGGSRPTDTNKQGVKNNNMFDFGGVDFSGGSTKKKDDFIDFSGKSAPSGNDNNVFDLSGNNQVQSSHITGTQQKAPISTEDLLKSKFYLS